PLIINLKKLDRPINAVYATLISTALLIGFFYAGDLVLKLFSVDIRSFAVAGAMILFFMAIEMILDIELFKNNGPVKDATLIPIVFPLIAGPGAFTTLLSLRAEYAQVNIIIGILLNMLWVFFVLKMTEKVNTYLGKGTIYIMRKFFGIILLAISVRMFMVNLAQLLQGSGTAG
uniref:MarC family protein n=1 Tax=Alloprevotella tannerae TaxID=76122 RepID=UPI0028E9C419